jgi:hypothetical protein
MIDIYNKLEQETNVLISTTVHKLRNSEDNSVNNYGNKLLIFLKYNRIYLMEEQMATSVAA